MGHVLCAQQNTTKEVLQSSKHEQMTYWHRRQWPLCFCHHTPPRWQSALYHHHNNLHHQAHSPWTGTASSGMERSFTEFKQHEKRGKNMTQTKCAWLLHAIIPGLATSHQYLWNREISGLYGMQEHYPCEGAPVLPHCSQRISERQDMYCHVFNI